MPTETLLKSGNQIFLRDATDFSSTSGEDLSTGTQTTVQLDMGKTSTGLVDGGYRESDSFDFGATRGGRYSVQCAVEFQATPTAGEAFYIYLAESDNNTAWPAGLSGSDGDYTGYSSNEDDAIAQCRLIGVMKTTAQATATVQIAHCGTFTPKHRYGVIVVRNESGAATVADGASHGIWLTPVIDEAQTA